MNRILILALLTSAGICAQAESVPNADGSTVVPVDDSEAKFPYSYEIVKVTDESAPGLFQAVVRNVDTGQTSSVIIQESDVVPWLNPYHPIPRWFLRPGFRMEDI